MDVRVQLRKAQQKGDLPTLEQTLTEHPELEFADNSDLLAILAVIYFIMQQPDQAGRCLEDIDPAALTDAGALADYGMALFMAGKVDEAKHALDRAGKSRDAGFEVFARQGTIYITEDELGKAETCLGKSIDLNPERSELLSNLGGVKFRQGLYQEAIELYDRALSLRPDLVQTREMRSKALISLDRSDELVEEAYDVLEASPDEPERHLHLANVMMQAERFQEAEATLDAAVDRFPERDDLKQALVNLLFENKAHWKAGVKLRAWAEERDEPDWISIALNRARIEANLLDAAQESLDALSETHLADEAAYPVLRAKILIDRARADEAVEILYEAVEKFPGNIEARNLLAHTLTSLGRLDEAGAYYDEVSKAQPMAIVRHVEGKGNEADDEEIERLTRLFESHALTNDARSRIGFTLASCLEKRKEHEQAFPVLQKANKLARKRLNYNWKTHRNHTDKQIEHFTEEVVENLTGLGFSSNRPIFITGMPRSGTTLTEQILCSHPEVYGAGELQWVSRLTRLMPKVVEEGKAYPEAMKVLTERNLKSAAKYYLDKIALQDPDTPRVVDKMPHNFDNIGLIALMFPNAVIIHMDREKRDVAVSNYFQNFAASHGLMGFAYDLQDIGHMLNDHDRIMQHWHELFPGRIYELNYQELVGNPENVIADLLKHCGLEWDDRVLKFYETKRPVRTASIRQVRKGIYKSSAEKWRRYETFLEPLEEVLAEGYKSLEEAEEGSRFQNVIAGPTGLITT